MTGVKFKAFGYFIVKLFDTSLEPESIMQFSLKIHHGVIIFPAKFMPCNVLYMTEQVIKSRTRSQITSNTNSVPVYVNWLSTNGEYWLLSNDISAFEHQ